jgi:hypothetical protein
MRSGTVRRATRLGRTSAVCVPATMVTMGRSASADQVTSATSATTHLAKYPMVARCAKDGESACAGSACAMPFRLRRKSWTSKRDTAGSSASATIIIATTTEESYVEVQHEGLATVAIAPATLDSRDHCVTVRQARITAWQKTERCATAKESASAASASVTEIQTSRDQPALIVQRALDRVMRTKSVFSAISRVRMTRAIRTVW